MERLWHECAPTRRYDAFNHGTAAGEVAEDAGNCNTSDPPTEVVRDGAAADATHRVARGAERETDSTEARRLRSEILAKHLHILQYDR